MCLRSKFVDVSKLCEQKNGKNKKKILKIKNKFTMTNFRKKYAAFGIDS